MDARHQSSHFAAIAVPRVVRARFRVAPGVAGSTLGIAAALGLEGRRRVGSGRDQPELLDDDFGVVGQLPRRVPEPLA